MTDQDRIRVWNEETGEMLEPATIQEIIRNTHNLALIHREHIPPESEPYGHLVFMRNTGINDHPSAILRRGVEIFAEDLITHSTDPWVYRVMQKRGCWWAMSFRTDMAPARMLNNIFHPTIVGNVFENRELMMKGEIEVK